MIEKPMTRTNITQTNNSRSKNPPEIATSQASLSANEVSRIVRTQVREGQVVKGESRIKYVPYQRKITQYETRQRVERVPVRRKVIEYREERVMEQVPREVIKTDYYAVENIKQYYKEIIPERKIEMMPIERKVKRVEYVPVERQVVHYPENHDEQDVKDKSRIVLGHQGIEVRPDAQFKPIDPKLLYQYSDNQQTGTKPVGYVEDGYRRYLSTSPSQQPEPFHHQQLSFNPTQWQEVPHLPPIQHPIQQPQMYECHENVFTPIEEVPRKRASHHTRY